MHVLSTKSVDTPLSTARLVPVFECVVDHSLVIGSESSTTGPLLISENS